MTEPDKDTLPIVQHELRLLALPYKFEVLLPAAYMTQREVEFQAAQGTAAPPATDTKGRMKYFQKLYDDILTQGCHERLTSYILYAANHHYQDNLFDKDETPIVALGCQLFFMPVVHFPEGRDWELSVPDAQPVTLERIAAGVQVELDRLRASKAREQEKVHPLGAPPVIEEGDIAVITMLPTIDGAPWAQGRLDNSKLRVVASGVHPEELYQKLLGLGPGNHVLTFVLTDKFGPALAGKQVNAVCTIRAVLTYALPELNDAFAQEVGHETLEELRSVVQQKTRERLEKDWNLRVGNEAVSRLITLGDFGPVPEAFVVTQAKKMLAQQKTQVRGDLRVLYQHYRVDTEEAILGALCRQVEAEVLHVAPLVSYGTEYAGLVPKDYPLQEFIQRALDHLLANRVRLVPVDMPAGQPTEHVANAE